MTHSNLPTQDNAVVDLLSTYFAQRGQFLSQVILADLVNSPYLPTKQSPSIQPTIQPTINGGSYTHGLSTLITEPGLMPIPARTPNGNGHAVNGNGHAVVENGHSPLTSGSEKSEKSEPTAPPQVSQSASAQALLIELVVEQTGFPADSFSPDARLLDDLNLDSIKSAELVAQVAKQIGIESQVDPAAFANASLAEVAAALEQLAGSAPATLSATGAGPADSSGAPGNKAMTDPTLPNEEITSWVRNFSVDYVAEASTALSSQEAGWQNAHLFPVDNWETASVLIVTAEPEAIQVEVLTQALGNRGATVRVVSFLEMQAQSLAQSPKFTHFIAVMPQQAQADLKPGDRLQQSMEQMYTLATLPQASKAQRDYTNVTYIQFGGGYFGKQQQLNHLEQGCLIGFASTVHLERPDLKVRVIDIPRETSSTQLMDRVLEEIARPDGYLSVGYDPQLTRRVPRPVIQDRTQYQKREIVWTDEDVILVTGGAKGITAECVLGFAQVTGVKMALVGRSAHPQDNPTGKSSPEIARTLRRFQKEGLTCQYYACDVADSAAVQALVDQVETELGAVTGVIHGAAINRAQRAENCPVSRALPEISPKVLGMFNLCEVLKDHPPKLFAGISSIGAVIGLPGNAWYSFSNEVLDLLLRRFGQQYPETEVFSVAYSVWADVGMGARMGTVKNLGRMGIKAIPMQEGVDRFVQLMFNTPGDAQVVITSSLGGVQTLGRGFDTWRVKRVSPPAEYRFIETLEIIDPGIEIVARTHLSLDRDSYVRDHIYNGTYLFPTVFGLEAMAQMVAYATGQSQFNTLRIEDIRLERPIVVDPNQGVTIELRAEVPERESAKVPQRVMVEIRTEQTGFAKAHFAATFVLCEDQVAPIDPIERPAQPLGLNPHTELYGGLLWQGTRFHRLQTVDHLDSQQMVFTTQRGVAAIAPEQPFDRADGPFILGDPYCRDALLQSVQPMVPQDVGLPIGIQSIQLYQPSTHASDLCLGVATGQAKAGRNYTTAVLMTDQQGQVIERLEGYQIRIVDHRPDNPTIEDLVQAYRAKYAAANAPVHESVHESVHASVHESGKVKDASSDATDVVVHERDTSITVTAADESINAQDLDEQLLRQELRLRAEAMNVSIPQASLTNMPGLHELSPEERHEQELPLFKRTVGLFLGLLMVSLFITGAVIGTSLYL